jgi:hypothetical protein
VKRGEDGDRGDGDGSDSRERVGPHGVSIR